MVLSGCGHHTSIVIEVPGNADEPYGKGKMPLGLLLPERGVADAHIIAEIMRSNSVWTHYFQPGLRDSLLPPEKIREGLEITVGKIQIINRRKNIEFRFDLHNGGKVELDRICDSTVRLLKEQLEKDRTMRLAEIEAWTNEPAGVKVGGTWEQELAEVRAAQLKIVRIEKH